jgi:WD40 repeat protein
MKTHIIIIISLLLFACGKESSKLKLSASVIRTELPVSDIELSPNKELIAIAYRSSDNLDSIGMEKNETYKIIVLDTINYSTKFELLGHDEEIESVSFSADSKSIVSTDRDGVIFVWDLSNGKQKIKIESGSWVHKAKFSNSGNEIIAIQGYDEKVLLYDIDGNIIDSLDVGNEIRDFDFNYKTGELFLGCYNEIQIWSIISRKKIRSIPLKKLMCIKFNNQYSQLAIGLNNGDIVILSNTLKKIYQCRGHNKPVLSVGFSFDDRYLGSTSSDKSIRIWDLEEQIWHLGEPKEIIKLPDAHNGSVYAIEFITENYIFMTGGLNHEIKVWQ